MKSDPGAKAMSNLQRQLKLIAALLREETTLSLATTCADGEPSIAPLFYIADEELNLYWLSSRSSEHSQNLLRSPRASAAIYCSAKSWREIRGVQLRGPVGIVAEPERRAVIVKKYCERFNLGRVFSLAIRRSTLYSLQPEFFRLIDNSKGFGGNFELTRPPEGWPLSPPAA
jgi:uncharacterized protein YhbP (UPF0306 family)